MITRCTLEGALKCALRLSLRLEWRWELIFVIAVVLWTERGGRLSVSTLWESSTLCIPVLTVIRGPALERLTRTP
jgi:hypothetical protein